jgi:hypothetical protein
VRYFPLVMAAIAAVPFGCTILADAALPDGSGNGGGGAGGTSAGVATGGSPSGTSGGTATGDGEICFNGLDDNDDGLTDCGDPACGGDCVLSPEGSQPVAVVSGDTCPNGFSGRAMTGCEACNCTPDDPGTCVFEVELYDNALCAGSPTTAVSPGADCDEVTPPFAAIGGNTVGAIGTTVGADDATCVAPMPTVTGNARMICMPQPEATGCNEGLVCVPPVVGMQCALFPGDAVCPASLPTRDVLFDGDGGQCACACDGGSQTCPVNKHVHTWDAAGCGGGKFDVVHLAGCVDTGHTEVASIDQHEQPLAALSADSCVNTSTVPAANAFTLCCP